MRKEKFSPTLLCLINPIPNSMTMIYGGSVHFEISNKHQGIRDIIELSKTNRREGMKRMIDLFLRSVIASRAKLNDYYGELIVMRQSDEMVDSCLERFDEQVKKDKEDAERKDKEDAEKKENEEKEVIEGEKDSQQVVEGEKVEL